MIGVIGSKEDARSVFAEVRAFLTEALALTVSEEKSGIRKASDGAAFLGYEVRTYTTRQRVDRSRQGSVSFLRRPPSEVRQRSEERRVGKGGVGRGRSCGWREQ